MSVSLIDAIISRDETAILKGGTKHEVRQVGGTKATGKIVFTAQPTAGHTITVGTRTLTFRAAADADLDEVELGADLSATITAIIAKLATYSDALLGLAVYTKTDTNTALTVTSKVYSAAYNGATGFPLASSNANGTVTAMAGGVNGYLSLKHEVTYVPDTETTAQGFTLAVGEEGQRKTVVLGARTNAVNVVVAPLGGGVATVTFSAAGHYANLICLGGKWISLGGSAAFA